MAVPELILLSLWLLFKIIDAWLLLLDRRWLVSATFNALFMLDCDVVDAEAKCELGYDSFRSTDDVFALLVVVMVSPFSLRNISDDVG